jgi:hypothetical protein
MMVESIKSGGNKQFVAEKFLFFFFINFFLLIYFAINVFVFNDDFSNPQGKSLELYTVLFIILLVSNILSFYLAVYRKSTDFLFYSLKEYFISTENTYYAKQYLMPKKIMLFYEPLSKSISFSVVFFIIVFLFTKEFTFNINVLLTLFMYYVITQAIRYKMICYKYDKQIVSGFIDDEKIGHKTIYLDILPLVNAKMEV